MTPRVLVTRAVEDAAALAAPLTRLGFEPVLVPLVERLWDVTAVLATAERHPQVDVVFVSSATTADVIATAAPQRWGGARWVAVGPTTAARLQALGLPCHGVAPKATAADLAASLGDLTGKTVLYPKADLADPGTTSQLQAAGAAVIDVIAYRNQAPAGAASALLAALPVAATRLMSGSAAERLASVVPAHARQGLGAIIAIGPSTARTCSAVGLPVARVATQHSGAGVVQALLELFPNPTVEQLR